MLDQKINLNKFQNAEDLWNRFSDHSGIKLEITNSKQSRKFLNICKLHNTLVNNPLVKKKSQGKLENISKQVIKKALFKMYRRQVKQRLEEYLWL